MKKFLVFALLGLGSALVGLSQFPMMVHWKPITTSGGPSNFLWTNNTGKTMFITGLTLEGYTQAAAQLRVQLIASRADHTNLLIAGQITLQTTNGLARYTVYAGSGATMLMPVYTNDVVLFAIDGTNVASKCTFDLSTPALIPVQ